MMRGPAFVCQYPMALAVLLRRCRRDDLGKLEWFGLFTPHRELIRSAFERQERGENYMLVAEINDFPVGQVWIDLATKAADTVGVLWAIRVLPSLRNLGIGTRLLDAAEEVLGAQGFALAEIGVEKDDPGARRLYLRRGYRPSGEEQLEYSYTTAEGETMRIPVDQWLLRKGIRQP